MNSMVSLSFDLALESQVALDFLLEELSGALESAGLILTRGPDGYLSDGPEKIASVTAWEPPRRIVLRWRKPDWTQVVPELELQVEPVEGGSRVILSQRGWGESLGDPREVAGWMASQLLAPLVQAMTPARVEDWLTDRRARRPSGAQSRGVYRDPLYHYPNFRVILDELAMGRADYLIDIGCGGGALLREALKSGCRAAGIDHSLEMVRLAREANSPALADGRLVIEQADAAQLPFPDATFTCASMTGVLGFLPDAVAAFRELRRVLKPGGRLVAFGSDPALRGTPAAPEPIASRLRFYDDTQLRQLALSAGFAEAKVIRRELLQFAREAGVPEEHLPLFAGRGAPFLVARK